MRTSEVVLEYQPLIHEPPVPPAALYQSATTNDAATTAFWKHIWVGNARANKERFGSFAALSMGQEFNKYLYQPAIVAGSGPSLKVNAHELKNRGGIPLISCLHNFHYFEDLGLAPEYYITLDAGHVVLEEVTEGGTRSKEEYWEMTKDRTLIAFIATDPEVLSKWKGRILFFNSPFATPEMVKAMDEVERFNCLLSSGGNVLGAALYFSKAVLGCSQSIFVGADFCFGYDQKFHAWDSKYDASQGQIMRVTDIYGNSRKTWPSYYGFKNYFDSVPLRLGGVYYNCTEGGCLGAYPGGNLSVFKYMDLKDCLSLFHMNDAIKAQMFNGAAEPKTILYS